jgi:hypothetical protein
MAEDLLKRAKEFQSEQAHLSHLFLPQDPCGNRWSFTGDQARRGRGRGRDGQVHELIGPKNVRRGDASAIGTDIKGLGQFDEFCSRGVGSAYEDRHL